MLEPRALTFNMVIEMVKTHKPQYTDSSTLQVITEGSRTIRCESHKLINSVWNKVELPVVWKESIISAIYKKGDKTDHSNGRGISRLSTMYKILSIICC